jgi:hypothetical protein
MTKKLLIAVLLLLSVFAGFTIMGLLSTFFNLVTPSQTGNNGKYLTTNGTITSWATVAGGGSTVEIDAKARGVVADGVTDNYALLQALVVEAENNATVGAGQGLSTIRLPAGFILISHPLMIQNSRVTIIGNPGYGTYIISTFGAGPIIFIGKTRATIAHPLFPTGASLAMGPGAALLFDNTFSKTLALSQLPGMYLGQKTGATVGSILPGLTEFTAELFVNPTANNVSNNYENILTSSGTRLASEGNDSAFKVRRVSTNALQLLWRKADGTTAVINSTATLLAGVTHHIAVVLSAGTVTLYIDGVANGSYSETGLQVYQKKHEEVTLCGGMTDWPYGSIAYGGMPGRYDGIRFSKVARYTAAFTPPTAKPTSDANTLLQINGDNIEANFIVGTFGAAAAKAYIFTRTVPYGLQIGYCGLENLFLVGPCSGLLVWNSIYGYYKNIRTYLCWEGAIFSDVFDTRIQDCYFDDVRISLGLIAQAEEMTVDHVDLARAYYPLVCTGATGGIFSNLAFTPKTDTLMCGLLKGGDMTILHHQIDDEGQATGLLYGFGSEHHGVLNIVGGQQDITTSGWTPFWLDNANTFNLIGTIFGVVQPITELIKVTGTQQSINLQGWSLYASALRNFPLTTSTTAHIESFGSAIDTPITGGSANIVAITSPVAPTLATGGTAGTTSYSYKVTALQADRTETTASPQATIATGNATLSTSGYNRVTITPVTGASSYNVYRTASAGTPASTGLIGNTLGSLFLDTGIAATTAAPTVNNTGTLAVGGTASFGAGVRSNAVTFANAITSPVEGTIQSFTDSTTATWGATITGSGANHVLGYYNGTNWTVFGK